MALKHKAGAELWLVPIRYWEEDAAPTKVTVVEDVDEAHCRSSFLVFKEGDPQQVYVPAESCYTCLKRAKRAIMLLTMLYENREDDENEFICNQVLKRTLTDLNEQEPDEIKVNHPQQFYENPGSQARHEVRVTSDDGYLLIPVHHISERLDPRIHMAKAQEIFWNEYDAKRRRTEYLAKHGIRCELLHVEVTSLKTTDS